MLYLLYGNNFDKVRSKLRDITLAQKKKDPHATLFRMDGDSFEEARFEELFGGQGLFQSKYIVVLDGLISDKKVSETVIKSLKECAESQNIFIIIEEYLSKEHLKKIEKLAEKVQEFSLKTAAKEEKPFQIFSVADALGRRDGKGLWLHYQRGLFSGVDPEEMHRIMLWQVKSMIIATNSLNAGDAGLNPFVWRKARDFAKNYKEEELAKLSADLVSLYHNARRGKGEFEILLERFVLGL